MFFMIGSTLKSNEALETLKQECGEFNFPQIITVKNHMPRDVVGAQVNLFLDSNLKSNGVTAKEVEFPTFGHLMQFVTDIELVAKMNGFENAVSLSSNTETPAESQPEEEIADVVEETPAESQPEEVKHPKRGRKKGEHAETENKE